MHWGGHLPIKNHTGKTGLLLGSKGDICGLLKSFSVTRFSLLKSTHILV